MTAAGPPIDREARRNEIRSLYGEVQAARYEDTWQKSEVWSPTSEHHIQTIGELLQPGSRWLDVGCGTGFFLSQFPGVERAGMDLSPAMLAQARRNNPDALELREGDISIDQPDWHGRWDLVTSTGQAWGYLPTMDLIEQAARNMAGWTRTGGVLMIQPADIADVIGHRIDYRLTDEPPAPTSVALTGIVWTWFEDDEHVHRNQIWPSIDQWVHWLAHDFDEIEIFNWPHDPPPPYSPFPRRVLVARGKRAEPGPWATIRAEALPDPPGPDPYAPPPPEPATTDAPLDAEPPAPIETRSAGDPDPTRSDTPIDEATAPASPRAMREVARSIYHRPLSEIVGTYAPWRGRVWRGVRRRLPRGRRSIGPTSNHLP